MALRASRSTWTHRSRSAFLCAFCALVLGLAGGVAAESALELPAPDVLGQIQAETYDESGERVGSAELGISELPSGLYELRSSSGIDGSARARVRAELETLTNGQLRPVFQETEARDEQGRSLGLTTIDHRRRVATCGVPEGSDAVPVALALPAEDRVANVPLNLLFQPLVTGDQARIEFQVLLCRAGARLVDAHARVAQRLDRDAGHLVEIRYDLDFGPVLSRLAAPFMPQLSFWFDESTPGGWVAHRMPLFSKGPTVLVVRNGFTPTALGTAH